MTPGLEAAVEPGTVGAAADPGHHSIQDGRIRYPGPGSPALQSMTAIVNIMVSIYLVR